MSLVAYGDSDSNSNSDSEYETLSSSDNSREAVAASGSKPIVLPPKQMLNLNFDLNVLDKNRSQPIRITIPSLKSLKGDDQEDEKPKLKPSTTGSGLFAVLPKPKNVVSASSSSLTPQSVMKTTQQKKPLPSPFLKASRPKPKTLDDDTCDNDETPASFFFSEKDDLNIDKHISSTNPPKLQPLVTSVDTPAALPSTELAPVSRPSQIVPRLIAPNLSMPGREDNLNQFSSNAEGEAVLDPDALVKLCGARERRKQSTMPGIIDVDGSSLMTDHNIILSKELTRELPSISFKRKSDCTSAERRKHQITYLAEQAKAQELELRNNWAQNRMTRKQTQAKYGF